MAVSVIPFTSGVPSALFCYWVTSNLFSLLQVLLLRVPVLRQFFRIPQPVQHKGTVNVPRAPPVPPAKRSHDGFWKQFNEGLEMARRDAEQRGAAAAAASRPTGSPSAAGEHASTAYQRIKQQRPSEQPKRTS